MKQVRRTADFEPVASGFKRIFNILQVLEFDDDPETLEPKLLEMGAELDLYKAFLEKRIELRAQSLYQEKLLVIASLRPFIDRFFGEVLVNAADPATGKNRCKLLDGILKEFSKIADFSSIVITKQESK